MTWNGKLAACVLAAILFSGSAGAFEVNSGFHVTEDSYEGFGWAPPADAKSPGSLGDNAASADDDAVDGAALLAPPTQSGGRADTQRPHPTYGVGFCLDCPGVK
jgi:hypothetical protein